MNYWNILICHNFRFEHEASKCRYDKNSKSLEKMNKIIELFSFGNILKQEDLSYSAGKSEHVEGYVK